MQYLDMVIIKSILIFDRSRRHGKNDFAENSKILVGYRSSTGKVILLNYQNNYVER